MPLPRGRDGAARVDPGSGFREDGTVSHLGHTTLLLVCAPYAAVAVGYLEARRRDEAPPRWARISGIATVALHLAALIAVGIDSGRSPFQTTGQALSFLSFSLAFLYVLLETTSGVTHYGGGFHLLASILAGAAVGVLAGEGVALPPRPRDTVLAYHMGLALLGTASILAGGLLGSGYLGAYRRVKDRTIALEAAGAPSLFGLQRLARHASTVGVALLAPSLVLGVLVVDRAADPSPWALVEMVLAAVELFVVATAAFLWWRSPRRGALAAWLNVSAMLLAIAAFLVIHPLLVSSPVAR
jgi:ABC-type uncharacterized transport system permease subunit